MKNVFCDKAGHCVYPLSAYEKDGKIYVELDSCHECGPRKTEDRQHVLDVLASIRRMADETYQELDRAVDNVKKLSDNMGCLELRSSSIANFREICSELIKISEKMTSLSCEALEISGIAEDLITEM